MEVVHVLSSLCIGGAERFVLDLGKLQIAKNHSVRVVTFGNEGDSLVSLCESLQIKVHCLTGNVLTRNFQFTKLISSADVVHIHTPHALRALLPSLWFTINPKVIYTRHGEMSMASKMWKRTHGLAKYIVNDVTFVSQKGLDIFKKEQCWDYIPHRVIENGFDTDDVLLDKKPANKVKLGSVGRMVALKGQKDLIDAVSNLPERYKDIVSIEFYGDGVERRDLEKRAFIVGDIEMNFHGVVTDRNAIYNNIDLMVVTSETEGLSLAMIEAMSYGNPVIASNVGGNPRLTIENVTGHLFEYGDVARLTTIIKDYCDNREQITKHGANSIAHISESFSLKNTVANYEFLYMAS